LRGQKRGRFCPTHLLLPRLIRIIDRREIPHDILCRHRLSRSRLSTDDDRLVPSWFSRRPNHAPIRLLRDGEQVRFEFALATAGVGLDDGMVVDGEGGEGVDSDKDDAGVGVDGAEGVAMEDGVEDCV
jgi:hypothetical protein